MKIILNANLVEELGTSFPSVLSLLGIRSPHKNEISLEKRSKPLLMVSFFQVTVSWCNGRSEGVGHHYATPDAPLPLSLLQLIKALIDRQDSLAELEKQEYIF